ncbi:PucR family transcriptional regulator ligand-binding domain-containing protein [Streptomyces sp. NPDC047024]|uniref:PucR family transcriptional regulator ligand-binding domain-containing protein n=1 Tax=Streptomyces sp. NPDC047024 TaxID=3155476 RepID=UPI0033F9BFE7
MTDPITPAVPPTPPVPLSALLAREDLGLRQIAGPEDPDTVIHWAHTSEMADPYPYLLGGELLLTAGVHVPEAAGSGAYFHDYVSRIVAAGGAALGFGLAPVHDTVPRALVAACEAHGLPLLEVPPRTTFSGIARAVWQLMAQARLAELRRVTEAQQSLAAAASRPDPVPSVLRQLAQRLAGHAVLYGPDGTAIATAGRVPATPGAREALDRLASVVRPLPPLASATGVRPLPPPAPVTGVRPLPGPATPEGDGGERPAAGTAHGGTRAERSTGGGTRAAQPTAGDARAERSTGGGTRAAQPTAGDARAERSTGGETPAEGATGTPEAQPTTAPAPRPTPTSATDTHHGTHLAAYALGTGGGFVLGVAAARRTPGDHTIASVAAVLLSLLTGEHQSGAGADRSSALVRMLLGAGAEDVVPLLRPGREPWVVVHARPEGRAPDAVAAAALGAALGSPLTDLARDVVRVLVPGGREPEPQPGWTLGVSAPAQPADWAAADAQAARALARARATRTALVRHGARPGLADLVPPADAEAHARALLAPLAAGPALAETLRAWLSLHGSWDRTAVALGVHRNTVRQRIARCAALLGADLDDPDVRMELWFALRRG